MATVDYYVATTGDDDTGDGSIGNPYLTPAKARDVVRAYIAANPAHDPIIVYLRAGTYYLSTSLTLVAADSGTSGHPVTWKSYTGETAVISGGQVVTGWAAVGAGDPNYARLSAAQKANLLVLDLAANGVTDMGAIQRRGFYTGSDPYGLKRAHMELFCDGDPMELASYPNKNSWISVTGAPSGRYGGNFTYNDATPGTWAGFDDVWVHGYFAEVWADSVEAITSVNTTTKTVYTTSPYHDYGYTNGGRFRFLNVLEACGTAGEYYVDRDNSLMYLWPVSGTPTASVVSMLDEEALIYADTVSYLRLEDLTLECTRGIGFEAARGTDVQVNNCTVQNIGTLGVMLYRGTSHQLLNSTVRNTGDGGVLCETGTRATLTNGAALVDNCDISYVGRWLTNNYPGVRMFGNPAGVGVTVTHCAIHHMPCQAVWGYGNDNVVEYCDIHDCTQQAGDVGVVYFGKSQTQRGNIIRYNYIHDTVGYMGSGQTQAIYLDDCFCSATSTGNIIDTCGRCILIGGGRDNTFTNNVCINCDNMAHVDSRGTDWRSIFFDGAPPSDTTMWNDYIAMNASAPPFSTAYVHVGNLWSDQPGIPKYNSLTVNLWYSTDTETHFEYFDGSIVTVEDNTDANPLFAVSGAKSQPEDYDLDVLSPAWALGWVAIPSTEIGLRGHGGIPVPPASVRSGCLNSRAIIG